MSFIVAIGDVHADYNKMIDVMRQLEEKIDFNETPVVFLGDIIDGALEAKQVIEQLRWYQKEYPNWAFLKGNHEDMMVCAAKTRSIPQYRNVDRLWWTQGGYETFLSFAPKTKYTPWDIPKAEVIEKVIGTDVINWLDSLAAMHESNKFLFVHAGFKPHRQPRQGYDFDQMWIRNEFIDSDYDWGKRVVAGHTFHPAPVVMKNKLLIDTMHHGHGRLTAVILNDATGEICEFVQSYETS